MIFYLSELSMTESVGTYVAGKTRHKQTVSNRAAPQFGDYGSGWPPDKVRSGEGPVRRESGAREAEAPHVNAPPSRCDPGCGDHRSPERRNGRKLDHSKSL